MMVDPFYFILFSFFLVVLVIAGIYAVWYLKRNVLNPMGKGMQDKTAYILWRCALTRGWKTLSDITIEHGGKTAHIENVLVGYFGLLLVHTCSVRGEYYGTLDSENWTISMEQGGKKISIPNPVLEQKRADALLRALLTKNGITGSYMVDHVVYMTSRGKKAGLYITHSGEILRPGALRGYLDKTKFERDAGLDVDKVTAVIKAAAGQNKTEKEK